MCDTPVPCNVGRVAGFSGMYYNVFVARKRGFTSSAKQEDRGQCGTCFWTGCWSEKEGTLFPEASGCGMRTGGDPALAQAPPFLVCHLLRGRGSSCHFEITSR